MSLSHTPSIDVHAKELLTNCGSTLFDPHVYQNTGDSLTLALKTDKISSNFEIFLKKMGYLAIMNTQANINLATKVRVNLNPISYPGLLSQVALQIVTTDLHAQEILLSAAPANARHAISTNVTALP